LALPILGLNMHIGCYSFVQDLHLHRRCPAHETLTQHPDALNIFLLVNRPAILEILAANRNTGNKIVGFKTCVEPTMEIMKASRQEISGDADLPAVAAL